MNPLNVLLLAASALFAWSMGSHYTGSVMGTAYGARVLTLRRALWLAAVFVLVGAVAAGLNVIGTYANVIKDAPAVDVAAAQIAASLVTLASTYYKLPVSTIQIYAFSLLGAALASGLPVRGGLFGLVVLGWVAGPLLALVLGFLLARAGLGIARRGQRALAWFLIVTALYSSFTMGSNDVSNAASSLADTGLFSPRIAALWGGFFMALGVVTWGRRLLERIGHEILPLDVPLAATAQFSKAVAISTLNAFGYNASINQSIVGGLTGVGLATDRSKLNRGAVRNITLNWVLSPLLGVVVSALVDLLLNALF
jgi:PiT family inorganic phosphate transporter